MSPTTTPPTSGTTARHLASLLALLVLGVAPAACGGDAEAGGAASATGEAAGTAGTQEVTREERLRRQMTILAADSMEGRAAGTVGERRARDFLVATLERYGVEPAGEDGYLQPVPIVRTTTSDGRTRAGLPGPDVDLDTIPEEDRRTAWNVLGMIPGTDPEVADEIVIVGSHYDHLGIRQPVAGDSIYNGADDDASGTVAALEIARAFATGEVPPPNRTVLIALFSAEEMGLLGPRWFLRNPTGPAVDGELVADLQIEMIGRPDPAAGGFGRGWLTGYERSTMGDLLAEQGSPIVADPRPDQRFFFRSDNLPFAQAGIPAHTLSSFNLHEDYHTPDDEADRIDYAHMTALVEAALEMVRGLATGPRPEWHEGGRPGGG